MVMRKLEEKLGLPHLSKLTETLEKLPDEKRLHELYKVLQLAEKVSASAPDLDLVIALLRELNALPLDKLIHLEKLLKEVQKVITKAPQDLLDFLSGLKED